MANLRLCADVWALALSLALAAPSAGWAGDSSLCAGEPWNAVGCEAAELGRRIAKKLNSWGKKQASPRHREILSHAGLGDDGGLPVVRLSGSPYEIGYQHGALLRERIRDNYAGAFRYMRTLPKLRVLTQAQVNYSLDKIWKELEPHVPADYLEEMRGLSDGAGVSLADVHRVHAVPDAFPTQCSLGAFFGAATAGGKFYQLRNLDWSREVGTHRHGAVFAVSPAGKNRFVNLGFAGFIGTLTGMNEKGITIGEVGSSSSDETHRGTSFVFLMRRVLEEAAAADEAAALVRGSARTVGINYVIGSPLEGKALALETTARHAAQFSDGDRAESVSPHAVPIKGAVFRGDAAFDPVVRGLQTCSNGNPGREGLEDPRGDEAYDVRYLGHARMLKNRYGRVTLDDIFALAKSIAPEANIQSAVFAYPEFWISYAQGSARAAEGPFHHFNMNDLWTEGTR